MLGMDSRRGWKAVLVRSALAAVLVVTACSLEVNINTGRSVEEEPVLSDVVEPRAQPTEEAEARQLRLRQRPAETKVEIPPPETPVVRHEEPMLPPPPPPSEQDVSEAPTFTPFTVAPSILNRAEVVRAMETEYPKLLRDAGVGGTVRVYFFIDEEGTVGKSLIDQSSGHEALDAAAMRVAAVYRFSPALNRNEKVPVWVSFPITFQVR